MAQGSTSQKYPFVQRMLGADGFPVDAGWSRSIRCMRSMRSWTACAGASALGEADV
jgi:hypothetical protein